MVPPSNTTSLEGSRVKLTCQAEGFPDNITYRWYRDGVDVQQTAALMTRAGIYADGSFVINSVQRDDAGWYTCRPTNGLGVPPEASAFLDVTCEYCVSGFCLQLTLPSLFPVLQQKYVVFLICRHIARKRHGQLPPDCLLACLSNKFILYYNLFTLFATIVPPECHKWGTKQKLSACFARSIVVYLTLKLVAPPMSL